MSLLDNACQKWDQLLELVVFVVVVPGLNVDAILLLPTEVFLQVVNDNCRLQAASDTREVFYVVYLVREIILQVHSMLAV